MKLKKSLNYEFFKEGKIKIFNTGWLPSKPQKLKNINKLFFNRKITKIGYCRNSSNLINCLKFESADGQTSFCGSGTTIVEEFELSNTIKQINISSTLQEGTMALGRVEIIDEFSTIAFGSIIVDEPNVFTSISCPQSDSCGSQDSYQCKCACGSYCNAVTKKCELTEPEQMDLNNSNQLCGKEQHTFSLTETNVNMNEIRQVMCDSGLANIHSLAFGFTNGLDGKSELKTLTNEEQPQNDITKNQLNMIPIESMRHIEAIKQHSGQDFSLSYLEFIIGGKSYKFGNILADLDQIQTITINPFVLISQINFYSFSDKLQGMIFINAVGSPIQTIGHLERYKILIEEKLTNSSTESAKEQSKEENKKRFKQDSNDNATGDTPDSADTANEELKSKEPTKEARELKVFEHKLESGARLSNIFLILIRSNNMQIQTISLHFFTASIAILNPKDPIYLNQKLNTMESFQIKRVTGSSLAPIDEAAKENISEEGEKEKGRITPQTNIDLQLALNEDWQSIYTEAMTVGELTEEKYIELESIDAPVFTTVSTDEQAISQFQFYKIEGDKYKIANRRLHDNQVLSLDTTGTKLSVSQSLKQIAAQEFYLVSTGEEDEQYIILSKSNQVNGIQKQYLALDSQGILATFVSADSMSTAKWTIKSLGGTISSAKQELDKGLYTNKVVQLVFSDEQQNETTTVQEKSFSFQFSFDIQRQFVQDHGLNLATGVTFESQKVILSKDLKFQTEEETVNYSLSTKNEDSIIKDKVIKVNIEPRVKVQFSAQSMGYEIKVPQVFNVISNGMIKNKLQSYGFLKGQCYVDVTQEVSKYFLDGEVWIKLPKAYTVKKVEFAYQNAVILSKHKENVYKFTYSNETKDIQESKLATTVSKQTSLTLKNTSGLYLLNTDNLTAPIPVKKDNVFEGSNTNYEIFMNIRNNFNQDIPILSDQKVLPQYKNIYEFQSDQINYEVPYKITINDNDSDKVYQSYGKATGSAWDITSEEVNLYFYDGIENLWVDHSEAYDIEDVEFLTNDIVLTNETIHILGSVELENMTKIDSVQKASFAKEFIGNYNFTHQTGFPLKAEDRLQAGVPRYSTGHFSLSPKYFTNQVFTEESTQKWSLDEKIDITVFAWQRMNVEYSYKQAKVNIPYKLHLRDKASKRVFFSYGTFHSDVIYGGDVKLSFITDLKNCNNRGSIFEDKKGLHCECDQGFIGFDCSKCYCDKMCVKGECKCTVDEKNDRTMHCECDAAGDFAGEFCHIPVNQVTVDSNTHKACKGGKDCRCLKGFWGTNCHLALEPLKCSGNGLASPVGQCVCDDGFQGPSCDCDKQCANSGICTENKCYCKQGFTGDKCQFNLDSQVENRIKCINDCSSNGKCHQGICDCNEGFYGMDCSSTIPCENGGIAVNKVCMCKEDWQGKRCELRRCPKNCNNHGVCSVEGKCVCNSGFKGEFCEIETCLKDCDGHGNCAQLENGPVCKCDEGWKGISCSEAVCDPACETNGGKCAENGVCFCPENKTGTSCHIEQCKNACNHQGVCGEDKKCNCNQNYMGDDCSVKTCLNECSDHGICVNIDRMLFDDTYRSRIRGNLLMKTSSLYVRHFLDKVLDQRRKIAAESVGDNLDLVDMINSLGDESDESITNNKSGISQLQMASLQKSQSQNELMRITSYKCICDSGFGGPDCSAKRCINSCSNKGSCDQSDPANPTCICEGNHTGVSCSEFSCPNDCSGHGTCDPLTGMCACKINWSGIDCSIPSCPHNCSGRGECLHEGVCKCLKGYSGPFCEIKDCPNDCSGNGTCLMGSCICGSGFKGSDCSISPCTNNCTSPHHGTCILTGNQAKCECKPSQYGEDCSQSHCEEGCNGHGTCVDRVCLCHDAQEGPTCNKNRCQNNCSNRGRCLRDNKCVCEDEFHGEFCEQVKCEKKCQQGRCFDNDKCICDEGQFGLSCNLKKCSDTCISNGKCNVRTGLCSDCKFGFEGADCEINNHMKCKSGLLLGNKHCRCFSGWTGEQCDTQDCKLPCLHGTCKIGDSIRSMVVVLPGDPKQCECTGGWEGKFCHLNKCKQTCKFGQCDNGSCVCARGYSGSNCDYKE